MDVSNVHEILDSLKNTVGVERGGDAQIYRSEVQRDNATRIAESLWGRRGRLTGRDDYDSNGPIYI